MSIYELMDLFVDNDQMIYIYDFTGETEVYRGSFADLEDDRIASSEVMSIDNIYPDNSGFIGINIEL